MYFYTSSNNKKNIIISNEEIKDSGLIELIPNTVEASKEKHLPILEINGSNVNVKVGEILHPMSEEHLILAIIVETTNDFKIKYLSKDEKAEASFKLKDNEKVKAVYEYCNLHGLWVLKNN